MSNELDELKEAAERAKENRAMAPVSLTMAILAVLVAHRFAAGPSGAHGRNPAADPGH